MKPIDLLSVDLVNGTLNEEQKSFFATYLSDNIFDNLFSKFLESEAAHDALYSSMLDFCNDSSISEVFKFVILRAFLNPEGDGMKIMTFLNKIGFDYVVLMDLTKGEMVDCGDILIALSEAEEISSDESFNKVNSMSKRLKNSNPQDAIRIAKMIVEYADKNNLTQIVMNNATILFAKFCVENMTTKFINDW